MHHLIKFFLLVVAFASVSPTTTFAAPTPAAPVAAVPVYALLSVIGDRLDVVVRQLQTGTRVDNNRRQPIAISEPVFDSAAVSAAGRAIRQIYPKAELAILDTRSQVLFDKQQTLFQVNYNVMTMPDAIRDALRQQGATKFILIRKHRDDANFQFATGYSDGAGKIEGLGFYLDGTWETRNVDATTGEIRAGRGFIAPFAYLEVTLIDFPSGNVLGKKTVTGSFQVGAGRAAQDIGEPWNALTSAEKVQLINRLIEREVSSAVQEIFTKVR